MYRIIKLKKVTFCQANVARMHCVDVFSLQGCSLCNNVKIEVYSRSGLGIVRNHSTGMPDTVLGYKIKRKQGERCKKKIYELLAVESCSLSEEKAQVTPLKVKELTQFVKCPNLSLQEMYKLRSRYKLPAQESTSSSSSQVPESCKGRLDITLVIPSKEENQRCTGLFSSYTSSPLLQVPDNFILFSSGSKITINDNSLASDISKDVSVISTEEVLSNEKMHSVEFTKALVHREHVFQSGNGTDFVEEVQEQKEVKPKIKKLEKEHPAKSFDWDKVNLIKKRREDTYMKNLETYFQVCGHSGLLNQCILSITRLCSRSFSQNKVPRISLFEVLLNCAASNGSIDSVRSILDLMHRYEIKLSLNCYAACFECIGRSGIKEEDLNMLSALLEDLKIQKYKVEDIFTQCKVHDQRSMVLKAIRAKMPDFEILCDSTVKPYAVKLLSALNDTSEAKSERFISPASELFSEVSVSSWIEEQIHNDIKGYVKIPNLSFTCDLKKQSENLIKQAEIDRVWAKSVRTGLLQDLKTLKLNHNKRLQVILQALPTDVVVELLLEEVRLRMSESDTYSPPMSYLCSNLGTKFKRLHDLKILTNSGSVESLKSMYKDYCKWYLDPVSHPFGPSNPREIWNFVERRGVNTQISVLKPWSSEILLDIGKFLYSIILRDITIEVATGHSKKETQTVPAFYTIYRRGASPGLVQQLKMHPAMIRTYQPMGQPFLYMETFDVPMVAPPVPWTNSKNGAFLLLCPELLRIPYGPGKRSQREIQDKFDEVPTQQIYPALDTLNQLGSIPWKINVPVLDVVTKVFKSGGSVELDIPLSPSTKYPHTELPVNPSKQDRAKYHMERSAIRKQQSEMYSLWCDALYRLSLAHYFKNRFFWLPHNMDFRGRVYPIAPHLQHMGCDMARSLLIFAKGEKLGPNGLDWLKIHTINLTGLKKRNSLAERLSYANEILDEIIDSADHPLTGCRWWTKSDEPWQTLAACKEIAAAIRSGDPENFVSHFPVHQDGSCNGLQHYAALGRDSEGAASVNLAALDKPADVYSRVAEIVERRRNHDAECGVDVAQQLKGFVTRKVVKQTVMTTVYGVTKYGARLQIGGQLKDLNFPPEKTKAAALYLADLTFESIGEMFSSTRKIQDWLTNCAHGIGKVAHQPVRWITPLGLPVVQPYFKQVAITRNLMKEAKVLGLDPSLIDESPNILKQRNGFPPNFVHSLDSCHMMMTALFCEQSGVTYVSVHDCFWVHPCNVDKLNKICREQFVSLHSEPILDNLSQYLVDTYTPQKMMAQPGVTGVSFRYLKNILKRVPPKGNFNLQEVLSSVYFFS